MLRVYTFSHVNRKQGVVGGRAPLSNFWRRQPKSQLPSNSFQKHHNAHNLHAIKAWSVSECVCVFVHKETSTA